MRESKGKDGDEPSTSQCAPPTRGEPGALCAQPSLQDHCRGDVSFLCRFDYHPPFEGMISLGNTAQSGRSEWATPQRREEQLLSSTRTFLTLKMHATTSRDSMCATGMLLKNLSECNPFVQVSGGSVLPGQQGFREAGRSEEGGRPSEDEGEIQPEHSCPLTLISYDVPCFVHLNHFFGGWFVCILKNKWHFLQIKSMDGGESFARLTQQVGQSVNIFGNKTKKLE